MPEETLAVSDATKSPAEVKKIIPTRDDAGVLYLNKQGAVVSKKGLTIQVRDKGGLLAEVPISELRQITVFGNIQFSTQTLQAIMKAGIPVTFLSSHGSYYGIATGVARNNVQLRLNQFNKFQDAAVRLELSKAVVIAKIANQKTFLARNCEKIDEKVVEQIANLSKTASSAESIESLLGMEGAAASTYFENFPKMLKQHQQLKFDWNGRNRRPPKDPINALLSLAYALLLKDVKVALLNVGFDPSFGFFHAAGNGRPSLALDMMEEFRPLIADSVALTLINNRMLNEKDFIDYQGACYLTESGRRVFFETYERRKDELVTHPIFQYRVSYNRIIEIQARLLARFLQGEAPAYQGFTTR